MKKTILMTLVAAAAAELFAVQGTVICGSEEIKGEIKWQARNKQYIIAYKKGKTEVNAERKLEDVTSLDIPEPAGFAKAVGQVENGQGTPAIPVLQKIVTEYRMLVWDKPAGRYLALAYLASGNAQKAYEVCQPIISEDKSAAYTGDLAAAYWQALLKLGKNDQLEGLLKKAVANGDRAASAAALVMRGDIILHGANDNPALLKQALTDGYLRVALMYRDQECRRECGEAMLKAAGVFEKLGQTGRAETLRGQAKAL